uniref:RNA-binding protein with serine-rich domain 1 n=2 Tax=Sus scrofa TaxID=9823 RepID=A0A8D1X1L3_PIG
MDLSGVKKKSLLGVKENNKKSSTRAPSPTKRKDRSEEKSKDRSKDKGATKESSEKDRGRDKTRKRRSASSGSSSTRSRSSSTSSSGSSTSTGSSSGSSSSSASSRSGSSSTSRSSSSSSSSGSPSPSRRRHDNRRRSRSKSKPPKRDEKERKRRSPSPKPTKVHIGRLTRNVTKDHIMEIFSTYGKIKMIDMPVERMHPHLSKGYAYVEFENPDEAEKALKHMDGGQIDGQEITATAPSQENAATTSYVAQVTPTDEEKVAVPQAQVPCAPTIPLPWPPPPQEPLQLQLLPISGATEALPLRLMSHPAHFHQLSSQRGMGRNEGSHSGAGLGMCLERWFSG